MVVSGRRGALCLALVCVAGLMAGCATSGGGYQTRGVAYAPPPDGTNAPVQGGVNVTPGSEEDFMVNVGRRTFFAPVRQILTIPRASRSTSRCSG